MQRWYLLSLLVLILASCDTTGSTSAPSTPPPTSAPTVPTFQLGETVTVPGWKITIKSARTARSSGTSTPNTPGDVFLIIEMSIQNTGTIEQRAASTEFQVQSTTGTDYGPPYIGVDGLTEIDGLVAVGALHQGQLVYAVPPGIHQFTLFYADSDGQILAQWPLQVEPGILHYGCTGWPDRGQPPFSSRLSDSVSSSFCVTCSQP